MTQATIRVLGRDLSVLIEPAKDVLGQWLGHCLDLDIVSAGVSREHALEMITEAVQECVADDIADGRNPFDRRQAPPEFSARADSTLT